MKKLHPNLVRAVITCLVQTFNDNQYADKVIERKLKSNKKWGARDRAFIAESTYEIVRWWRLLLYISGFKYNDGSQNITEAKAWVVFGAWWRFEGNQLPKWEEFESLRSIDLQPKYDKATSIFKVYQSIPDWLQEMGSETVKNWEKEMEASNRKAQVVLRANTLKISKFDLQKKLHDLAIESSPIKAFPDALVLKVRSNVFRTDLFKEGLFEVQDAGSQGISNFLDVAPEMRVIDACAGAGGKTLHLAMLMKNKGRIIALDVEDRKLKELKKRVKRAGVSIIESRLIESTKVTKRLKESADRLLLDVPCTGTGVLRRNPDAKWKLTPAFLAKVINIQQDLITRYASMLKVGGKMVYSTCSLLPAENEDQVQLFLENNKGYELEEEKYITPAQHGYDGFYMARILKKE